LHGLNIFLLELCTVGWCTRDGVLCLKRLAKDMTQGGGCPDCTRGKDELSIARGARSREGGGVDRRRRRRVVNN